MEATMEGLLQPTHLFFLMFALFVGIGLNIVVAALLYTDYQRVPASFRKLDPGLVWLLLIPCFNLVWNFFVFPKLSESFKAYFDSVGNTSVGDCGRDLGLGYAICSAVSIIPFVGCLTALASLVLVILFLMKANDLKNRIPITA
jgi:uncharacterized membrane protein